jgi:hypothetical protein
MFPVAPPTSGVQAAAPPAAQLPSAGQPPVQTDESSRETGTTSQATSASSKEINTPTKAATAQDGSARSRLSAAVHASPGTRPASKPVGSRPSRAAATSNATPPRFGNSLRAELAHKPVSRGWGESYAVRLLNHAGQPMASADVWLVARMADGTVERIPMGALPEPGIYRATVPTGRSNPVDLRVRVRRGDRPVEVSVKP